MQLQLSDRVLDLDRGLVIGADEVALSPTESRLLQHLALHLGRPVAQQQLLEAVWGYAETVQSRTVTVTVNRLRAKLEPDVAEPLHLLTERGYGYALHASPVRDPDLHPEPARRPLLGREAERRRVLAALMDGDPAVLLGGPGMGKSRLAMAVADSWPGPVAWFDLEPSRTVAAALGEVALKLGTRLSGPRELGVRLASRVELVVVDGAEHLAPGLASVLGGWAQAGLRILVTSRVPLAIEGARPIELGPLGADVAGAVLERFGGLEPDEVPAVVDRCEGVPLALVLEAATARSLGPVSGRGLQGSLARSWALLDGPHREALARCVAFAGDFDLDDARWVVGEPTLPRLHLLRAHGLLQRRGERLRLLASLAPAVEALHPDGARAGRRAHLERLVVQSEAWMDAFYTPRRLAALDALLARRPEIELALDFACTEDPEAACRLLHPYRYASAVRLGDQVAERIEAVRRIAPETPAGWRIRAIAASLDRDLPALEAALAPAVAAGEEALAADIRVKLAVASLQLGRLEDTGRWSQEGWTTAARPTSWPGAGSGSRRWRPSRGAGKRPSSASSGHGTLSGPRSTPSWPSRSSCRSAGSAWTRGSWSARPSGSRQDWPSRRRRGRSTH